jgi:hypothetical protein
MSGRQWSNSPTVNRMPSGRGPLRGNARAVDAARNGLLALFELLGDEDDRVLRYRALLQASIH